jgi:hypothetical protein
MSSVIIAERLRQQPDETSLLDRKTADNFCRQPIQNPVAKQTNEHNVGEGIACSIFAAFSSWQPCWTICTCSVQGALEAAWRG